MSPLRFFSKLLLTACFSAFVSSSNAQIVINEIQTSNKYNFHDEFYNYDDWIELYNAGSSAVDLNGYGLSDDSTNKYLFRFNNYSLASHAYLVVFVGDTEKTNIKTHWETPVKASDSWKYRANTTAPTGNWKDLSFNDAAWASGTGGIGFGDSDDGTSTSICSSIYMRKTFTIADTSKIFEGVFNMDFDDGFVAYLNGIEFARVNIGTTGTAPAWDLKSLLEHEAVLYTGAYPDSFHLDRTLLRSLLKNGTNVLAVETHNFSGTNSDLSSNPFLTLSIADGTSWFPAPPPWFHFSSSKYFHAKFKLSKTGEKIFLSDNNGNFIDQKLTGYVGVDNSIARVPDGSANWCLVQNPTPKATNNNSPCANGYATQPLFSLTAGFYPGTQSLALSSSFPGAVIRYTRDGSDVTSSSTLYSAPLSVTSTQTIRARVFSSGYLPSETISKTYLINFNCKLPVYSLTTDPDNLFDYNSGLFVEGPNAGTANPHWGANYWQDLEKPVTVEYFERNKNLAFQFDCALAITGGWSRASAQKSLELKLGDKYGLSKVNYPLASLKPWIDKWDNFILNANGQDKDKCRMRDALMNRLLKTTHCDYLAYEPVLLLINGQNWGIYNVRENDDHHWVSMNYGYKENEIDFLKESYFFPGIEVKRGSDSAYFAMFNYATKTSFNDPAYYSTISSMMDIENMTDYFIAETYYPNNDWMGGGNNNLKLWKPRVPGGKFHYLIYDLDFGLGLNGSASDNVLGTALNASPHNYNSELFAAFAKNSTFKRYFINRYADLMNTIFLPSNVQSVANMFRDSMRADIHFQSEKWGGADSTAWKTNITSMLNFASQRPAYARTIVQSEFGLAGQVTLTLQVSPAGAGRIQISTISPSSYPWNGVYFNGNPVTITAIPNPGYTFDHWRSNAIITTNNGNQSVTYNFTSSDVITCYFTGSSVSPSVFISEINYNSDSASNTGDWIELHNSASTSIDISNWQLKDDADNHNFTMPVNTVIPANGYLVICSDLEKFKAVFPNVTNAIGSFRFDFANNDEEIRLFNYNGILYTSVIYGDYAPWPEGADGKGYTLERKSEQQSANDGNNWFDGCLGGSPGKAYQAPSVSVTTSGSATVCQGQFVSLNGVADTDAVLQWRFQGTDLTGEISSSLAAWQSGAYTLSVSKNGCTAISDSIVVAILPHEQVTSTLSARRCSSGTVDLSANGTSAIKWYDASSGGMLLYTGNNFTTPQISQTTTFYAQADGLCPSLRMSVDAVVVDPLAVPVSHDTSRCGDGSLSLQANDTSMVYWYDSETSANPLDSGYIFNTPVLSQSAIYYVQSGSFCPGPRVAVNAFVLVQNPDPVATNVSRCGEGAVTITTSSANVNWYDAPAGNIVFTGDQYAIPLLSQTATFYLQQGTVCPSAIIPVTATINSINSDPAVTGAANCGEGQLTLSAVSDSIVNWYDSPGGTLIYSGGVFTTPVLSASTTYYAIAGTVCPGNFVPVDATVYSVPVVNLGSDTVISSGAMITLDAGSGFTYEWNTAQTTQTIDVNVSGTYYVIVADANGCEATDAINVSVLTGISSHIKNEFEVFPNPSSGRFSISLPGNNNKMMMEINDMSGKIIQRNEINANDNLIIVDGLSSGVYYLNIKNDSGSFVKKIVVQ